MILKFFYHSYSRQIRRRSRFDRRTEPISEYIGHFGKLPRLLHNLKIPKYLVLYQYKLFKIKSKLTLIRISSVFDEKITSIKLLKI